MKSMASMKTLLRLLGSGVLTTVAATSVVACGPNNPGTAMDAKVSENFGFTDTAGKSLTVVSIKIDTATKAASWDSTQLTGITADKLLATTTPSGADKAVSVNAGDFLVNVFKLTVVAGTGADRTFNHADATPIIMSVKTWSPTIAKKGTDDYAVNGGTAVVQFKKGTDQLGVDYTLNILAKPNDGIVANKFPDLVKTDFDAKFQTAFADGEPVANFQVGADLTAKLDNTKDTVKIISSVQALIKQGATKVLVTTNAKTTGNFDTSDTIKIQVSFGDVKFPEVTLTV